MNRLFGTDGIRGKALEPPLDENTVRRLGVALSELLAERRERPRVLLAGDTRSSTETLARWFGSAFQGAKGRVTWGGVLPTPAVSLLLRAGDFDAGVVISASHNPAQDNGIKVLAPSGEKLGDDQEARLERRLGEVDPLGGPDLPARDSRLAEIYKDAVCSSHRDSSPLSGLQVAVDAAHGAASGFAGDILEQLGARVIRFASSPNGTNINENCGATAPEGLAARVVAEGVDGGLALDGDADRAILIDEKGEILDGDDILLAWACHLADDNRLPGGLTVATVMSNYGLERALRNRGLGMIRCPVGDRAVWMTMQEHGAALGGEQSGHIICSHYGVSGDGLLTGTHLLAIAAQRGVKLSELSGLQRLPQVLINVPVEHKRRFDELPTVSKELLATESRLAGSGRVLLRYSGTEPLVRVMVEGEDAAEIETLAQRLATAIQKELGDKR